MDLHDIDKRLAVIEALSQDHARRTDESLQKIDKELAILKIRVYGMAGIISIIVGVAIKWLPAVFS